MKNFSFLSFIRDIGKHITVNYMMAKDSVKKRFDPNENTDGMSFTEFSYICTAKNNLLYKWEVLTSGVISLQVPSLYAA